MSGASEKPRYEIAELQCIDGRHGLDRRPALAAPSEGQKIIPAWDYRECMTLARENPELGFGRATRWLGLGGGDAAHHCKAAARTRWLEVIRRAPGNRAARSARAYLRQMDGPER